MTPNPSKIVITNPCSNDWNAMKINDIGRFCDSCAKSVVDFSNKNDEEIKAYILERKGESICGRFKKAQVDRIRIELDEQILYSSIPFWQKFLAIVLVCFGSDVLGCDFIFAQTDTIPTKIEQIDTLVATQKDSLLPEVELLADSLPLLDWKIVETTIVCHTVGWTTIEPEVIYGSIAVAEEQPTLEPDSEFSWQSIPVNNPYAIEEETDSTATAEMSRDDKNPQPKPRKKDTDEQKNVFIADLGNRRKRRK